MKITLAQINLKVGDIEGNLKKIKEAYEKAAKDGSDIIVFPELTFIGYQPLDMLETESFINKNLKALKNFCESVKETAAVVGFADFNKGKGKKLLNSAAFIHRGEIKTVLRKNLLPTYDIFDEKRYFEEGERYKTFKFKNKKILLTICEDIWSDTELLPDKNLYKKNIIKNYSADIIINISASPYHYGKQSQRKKILSSISKKNKSLIIYSNNCGANDELVFDGSSMIINPKGKIYQLPPFEEIVKTIDSENFEANEINEDISWIELAIVSGIKDYFVKQNFKKAVIGLSGGIDSAVVAYLCVKALGRENVLGVLMPSKFTSKQSIDDAIKLSKSLAIDYNIVEIKEIYEQYLKTLKLDEKTIDITLQNLQSRIRGNILMSYSNKYGYLVITTGNKSEISVGYSTLYGDTCGAIAPIGDLLKTDVYKLAEHINRKEEIIPKSIIQRPPTAELKPGQKDQDDLPPYKILDEIIKLYLEEQMEFEEIKKKIKDEKLLKNILTRIERNEYKRKQMPLVLKLSKKSFGTGRKMPIVKSENWHL